MANKSPSIAKIMAPVISGVVPRERLFSLLDTARERPIFWITGPPGSGKTTLIAGYLDSRKLPCLWYQVDEGDSDLSTFFYYMGLAAKKAAPRHRTPLSLLTPEYLQGISTFTRRYFENLFTRLKAPYTVVLDNYQEATDPAFHEMINCGLEVIPQGITCIVISRQKPPSNLSRLQRNHFFIARRSLQAAEYQYHQLFREFLLLRAKMSFTPEVLSELRRRAAGILVKAGQTEAAAGLFIEDRDWEGLIRIILTNAFP